MPTEKKITQVDELQEKLRRCTIAVATDPTGLSVNTLSELRQRLRDRGLDYRMVKNNLAYLAADAAGTPLLKQVVQGPTALAFGYQDPTEAAAALEEYIRTTRSSLTIRGGILGDRALTAADVTSLATMPPREVLMARVMGQLQAPIASLLAQLQAPLQGLLAALNAPLSQLAFLLQQRAGQLGEAEVEEPATSEPVASAEGVETEDTPEEPADAAETVASGESGETEDVSEGPSAAAETVASDGDEGTEDAPEEPTEEEQT